MSLPVGDAQNEVNQRICATTTKCFWVWLSLAFICVHGIRQIASDEDDCSWTNKNIKQKRCCWKCHSIRRKLSAWVTALWFPWRGEPGEGGGSTKVSPCKILSNLLKANHSQTWRRTQQVSWSARCDCMRLKVLRKTGNKRRNDPTEVQIKTILTIN